MTAKILKSNGNTRYVSTYKGLTPKELASDEVKVKMTEFTKQTHHSLGPSATAEDFENELADAHTPIYEPYEDEDIRDDYQCLDKYIISENAIPMDHLRGPQIRTPCVILGLM